MAAALLKKSFHDSEALTVSHRPLLDPSLYLLNTAKDFDFARPNAFLGYFFGV